MTMTYCPDPVCIEDECGPANPCCASICTCALTENCWVKDTGDQSKNFDGSYSDVLYCTEHKTEFVND
jgi:hypothetical protein